MMIHDARLMMPDFKIKNKNNINRPGGIGFYEGGVIRAIRVP